MKVLLISANTEPINMPVMPVGLGAVALSTRRAGHRVEMVDLMGADDAEAPIREVLGRFHPDVIGISLRNIDDQKMDGPRFLLDPVKEVVRHCRTFSNAPVVLGGAGYSIFPESALTYLDADMGIQGEGEEAFPGLLARMERGDDLSNTPGLHLPGGEGRCRGKIIQDLDQYPVPDGRLWTRSAADEPNLWVPVQSRRGCPMDCSYCSTAAIEGRLIRKRDPERVVEGIVSHVEAGYRRFFFVDNTFNLPPSYAKEICRALIARGLDISWRCILYPRRIDPELVRVMAEAGCREVSLGFESGCERILRGMKKRFSPGDVRRVSGTVADHGIRQMGFLLLGGPGETRESVEESLLFVDSLGLDAVKVTAGIRIYPYTALAERALAEGVILPEDDLLFPRFYMVRGLEGWLRETLRVWMAERSNWMT